MTTGLWLLVYGAVLTWLAPPLLRRLTAAGISPHMGVAAWLTAVVAAVLAWIGALALIIVAALEGVRDSSALTLCLELFGVSDHTGLPGQFGTIALIVAGLLTSIVVIARVGRSIAGLRSRSREHAHAARLIGRPTERPGVVVVEARRPAAYCVLGRPNAIVITSAALDSLDSRQLAAVLAHENAHIAGRHHQILLVLRALAANLPRLTLFGSAAESVAALLEMCADDSAARRVGTRPLLSGLLTLAGTHAPLPEGLAAAATAVATRALRLATPAPRSAQWRQRLGLAATMTATLTAPALIELLCHH
ncbi:M56 family metallopeptidase [Mycolicibacterium arseniciresistens]|uniref:M56 family metallopeptidase n=1 Tax=Mycolicibacterium arseniciresistens TaxID=3062257 RepID=A0ABT8UCW8_9MYCO|nr:M56 family metallopeptidase [Mycolicibacterium arseniciresistens]MDO3634991.1 M56 family metallopeptidase [Mycolicibacterium arseniciresistens]